MIKPTSQSSGNLNQFHSFPSLKYSPQVHSQQNHRQTSSLHSTQHHQPRPSSAQLPHRSQQSQGSSNISNKLKAHPITSSELNFSHEAAAAAATAKFMKPVANLKAKASEKGQSNNSSPIQIPIPNANRSPSSSHTSTSVSSSSKCSIAKNYASITKPYSALRNQHQHHFQIPNKQLGSLVSPAQNKVNSIVSTSIFKRTNSSNNSQNNHIHSTINNNQSVASTALQSYSASESFVFHENSSPQNSKHQQLQQLQMQQQQLQQTPPEQSLKGNPQQSYQLFPQLEHNNTYQTPEQQQNHQKQQYLLSSHQTSEFNAILKNPSEYLSLQKDKRKERYIKQGSNLSIQLINNSSSNRILPASALDITNIDSMDQISMKTIGIGSCNETETKSLKMNEKRIQFYMRIGEFEKAIEDIEKVLEIDPNNTQALFTRGNAYVQLSQYSNAILDFENVLELDATHVNAALAKANCLNLLGDYGKAIVQYEDALEKDFEKGSMMNLSIHFSKKHITRAWSSTSPHENSDSPNNVFPTTASTTSNKDNKNINNNNNNVNSYFDSLEEEQLRTSQNEQQLRHNNQQFHGTTPIARRSESVLLSSSPAGEGQHAFTGQSKPITSLFTISPQRGKQSLIGSASGDVTAAIAAGIRSASEAFSIQKNMQKISSASSSGKATQHDNHLEEIEDEANAYFKRGYDARLKDEFHKAIELYTVAIQLKPTFLKAVFNRGFLFDKLGEYSLACKDYTRAIEIDGKCAFAYFNRGISLDKQQEQSLLAAALADFDSAILLDSVNGDFYLNRGNVLQKLDRHFEAVHDYSRVVELKGNSDSSARVGGFSSNGKAKSSLKVGNENIAGVLVSRALSYEKCKEFTQAKVDYQKALELGTNSKHICYSRLASILQSEGNLDSALILYNKALSENSKSLYCLAKRAQLYFKLSLFQLACEDFSQAIAVNPSIASLYFYRGKARKHAGEILESTSDFLQALSLKPLDESALAAISENLLETNEFDEAKKYIDVEIDEFGESVERIYKRHMCLIHLRNYADAEIDIRKMLQFSTEFDDHSEDVGLLRNLSACLMRQKKFAQAEQVLSQIIDRSNADSQDVDDLVKLVKYRTFCREKMSEPSE